MTEATREMTDEMLAKEEEEAKEGEKKHLEAVYAETVELLEGRDFVSVEGIQSNLNVDQSTAVWVIEKLQLNGLAGNPEGNGYCRVLSRPEPSAEDSVDAERRDKTMLGLLKFGGSLEKVSYGKGDIQFTISIPMSGENLEKLARMQWPSNGQPGVDVIGIEADLEQAIDDVMAAKDDNQGELDLSGESGEGENDGD